MNSRTICVRFPFREALGTRCQPNPAEIATLAHTGHCLTIAHTRIGREALSIYKLGRTNQPAAEAGGTRDRRRKQCLVSGDEQARQSVDEGQWRGREHQRDRHLLEQKWGSCAEVGKHAKNYGYTRPYWYMPQPIISTGTQGPLTNSIHNR